MPYLTVCAVLEPLWPNLRPQFSSLVVSELRAINTEGTGGHLPFQILADQLDSPIPNREGLLYPTDFETFLRPWSRKS